MWGEKMKLDKNEEIKLWFAGEDTYMADDMKLETTVDGRNIIIAKNHEGKIFMIEVLKKEKRPMLDSEIKTNQHAEERTKEILNDSKS